MIVFLSDILGVSKEDFSATGAFNPLVGFDTKLFIDPKMLEDCETEELKPSYQKLQTHFTNIMTLLEACESEGDNFWRDALKLLKSKEIPGIAIGYAKDTGGSGTGAALTGALLKTARAIIKAGIKNPTIFELTGLFEEGIGPDRISDITATIILDELIAFSKAVLSRFDISKLEQDEKTGLPKNPINGQPIILVPEEILRPLPVANCWEEIDVICAHNEGLRKEVNALIGETWKQATSRSRVAKADLRQMLMKYPELIKDMITQYQEKVGEPYDFNLDPMGLMKWLDIAISRAKADPIAVSPATTEAEFLDCVDKVLKKYKHLVENNALRDALFDDNGKRRGEDIVQKTLFAVADTYCQSLNIDVSREVNNGRGPVDFKFSNGKFKVAVECKWGNHAKLLHGLLIQLEEYGKAEDTKNLIFLIVDSCTEKSKTNIRELLAAAQLQVAAKKRIPQILTIDGTKKASASKYEPENHDEDDDDEEDASD